ncbi:MAG: sulfatase [Planctomycetes bacterium RBG_13_63_9]|nr:MAG: sulfatase [Planctomycetes bacterium RBG_13_63_9]
MRTSAALGLQTTDKPAARRPNVLFLLADQWRAQATGYAGDPNVKTPRLDALARQSTNFTNAVSGCPVCSPYRGSLMTGRYPLSHGVFLNDVCLNNDAVSLAQAFNAAGYETGLIGKWHLDGHGRSSFVPPERRQGFRYWRAAECTHDYNHSHYYGDRDEKQFWNGYDAIAQTEEAGQYIRKHRDEPFVLVLSWGPPHAPYRTAPERFQKLYHAQDMKLRENVPKDMGAAARRDLAGYYAHCTALDECTDRLLAVLAECGLEDDTIVVFTSDHGDMLGSRGQYKKQRPWDESIRVPFLLRWPARLGSHARELIAPINAPDIMPTLLGLCGVDVPKTVEGKDRSPLLRGEMDDRDEPALIGCPSPFGQWTRQQGGREYRGVRTARYTYIRTLEGPWLLYDNREDPFQMDNLCSRPQHAALQSELEAQLKRRLQQTNDDFRPGSHYIKKWGYQTDPQGTVPYTS